jgi:hypothetical protein
MRPVIGRFNWQNFNSPARCRLDSDLDDNNLPVIRD